MIPAKAGDSPVPIANFDDGLARSAFSGGSWTYDWANGPGTRFELSSPGHEGNGFAIRVEGTLDGTNDSFLQADFEPGGAPVDQSAFEGVRFCAAGRRPVSISKSSADNLGLGQFPGPKFSRSRTSRKSFTILFKDLKQDGLGGNLLHSIVSFRLSARQHDDCGEADRPPSGMFEGMIAPLAPFRIRGILWYQGESNGLRGFQYRALLPALISGWRELWRQGDFPFLIVVTQSRIES